MYGVPTSTSSRRAGKKGFSRPTPTGQLSKIPRPWATPNFRWGSRGCWSGVGWSPPGAFPALSHVKSFIRSNTRCWDGQSAQETRAETRAPVTHQPPPRPASHMSHLHIHTLHSHTYPPPLPGHTLHALSVTVAKSRAHDHDSRPPARRPNRRPYGASLGPAQQRSPAGPDSLLRTGQTRSGLQVLVRSGRVLTAQGPLGNLVPTGTPAF